MLTRVVEFGQRVERLGFAGCWIVDAFARGQAMLDPLMFLSTLAGVTERIELGTCVMQVPLRHPVELAHRAQTLHVLSAGRFRFDRLRRLADIGFDDALLIVPFDAPDMLDDVRALLP
jgi:alkanesulfonate monooxygenase SsuD/methylene tetrahydromethanopterin reductase-like flavin-dependent oxidoreductase (luciferase family)